MLSGCGESNSAKPSDPPPPSVTVSEPLRRTVTEWDEFTGRFQAIDHVSIRPRVSGYLQSAHFQEGTMVKKGDLLFVIDPRPYEAAAEEAQGQLQTAQAQLTFAARDLERAVELSRTQALSQQMVDQRRQGLETAEAAVIIAEGAQTRQARCGIYAGRVSDRRRIRPGAGDRGNPHGRRHQRDSADDGGLARSDLLLLQHRRADLSQEHSAAVGGSASHLARQRQPVHVTSGDTSSRTRRMDWIDSGWTRGPDAARTRAPPQPQRVSAPASSGACV
jgi:multidrug efflux pump subunit AcrA (membrane-fusion protein)